MTGYVLAAIVALALLVAVLVLKKRFSSPKPPQIDAGAATDSSAHESKPQAAEEPPALPAAAVVQQQPAAAPLTGEETVTQQSEAISTVEPVEGVAEDIYPPVVEEVPLRAEPEAAGAESSIAETSTGVAGTPVVPEEEATATTPVAEPPMEPVTEELVLPENEETPVPAADVLPQVCLTKDAYSARLNRLEERQRTQLTQAIQQRDDKQRDLLQRELVLMNNKLALLDDSYSRELSQYQRILDVLERLPAEGNGTEFATAKRELQQGNPQSAEDFLARLSEQQHPFAAQAAFYSGQLAECRVDLQQALMLYRRAVDLEPGNPQYLQAAGTTARSLYRYSEALSWLETFVKLSGERGEREPVDQALALRELAYTYVLSGQYQKAGPLYKEAMTTLAQQLGQDHPEMATSWYQLGELQETLGEYDRAVSLYKKSLDILEKKRGKDHPVLAGILDRLAALCMELEMEKQAVPLYERLVRIREKALRPTHPQLALSLNNLAESYRLQGRYAEAEACYQKSLVINETLHGKEHPSVAAVLQELAKLCTSQQKSEEAKDYQQRASAIFQKSVEASEKKTGQESLTLEI